MTTTMMMKADSIQKEMDERNLRPRLCYLTKGECGYGFHLHGERSSGAQFIRRIEAGSPAELAGLRSGDRVVEVNGENVEKESHQQVVQKIMEVENRTRLLVVDRETDEFLLHHSLPCTEDIAVEMSCLLSPRTPSSSLASSTLSFSSSSRDSLTPSPPGSIILSPQDFTTHSLTDSITPSLPPKSITLTPLDSIAPLPSDSTIPSPQNSTPPPPPPRKPDAPSPGDSLTQSPRNSINQSPHDSIIPSMSNSVTQSPYDSITQSPYDSITQSPSNSITPPPSNSITQSPSNSITPPPSNSITPSPSNSITPSPYDSITQSPYDAIIQSPSNSITQSPYDSITRSPSDPTTTHFSQENSNETHITDIIITNNNKETSGTEDMVMHDLRPRLCHIVKNEQGFGFNLHCDKRRAGQFIRSVDPNSPAQRAGLQPRDRLIQVNGRSIEGLRHSEVVEIIQGGGGETKLLVVDPETDALFQKLGITPTTAHLNEDCVDGPLIKSPTSTCPITDSSASPTQIPNGLQVQPPVTNLTLTDPPTRNGSLKHQSHGSSASSRSITSEMSVELSSSDTTNKVLDPEQRKCNSAPGVQEVPVIKDLDPLWASGLHLSPTAAEARQKVQAKKGNKRAPPMAWNKKYELFSNF
ncbi:mucin-2 [Neoarius graeffei]|uniref:mucin-2 n=1 Tax=Neoarius graeffei TaxID=443677 RepID=UPI00298D4A9C|nr:mucin-2 [Neoarius graeffei]XP_060755112.1 mucin-2 [Neoarius graeffei]